MKSYFAFLACLLFSLTAFSQVDTIQKVIPGRKNSPEQQNKPYVILISADGFRYDYAEKYNAMHLKALADSGVRAESMLPSYPSVTFPNHYTIVTGLYPSHEGLTNNAFYDSNEKKFFYYKKPDGTTDPSWYKGGTPIWVLAEQQKMLSATFYWTGSEAPVQGFYPTYRYKYNELINMHNRIAAVVKWLNMPAETRPHFITFYFPQVDHQGHKHGPDSREVEDAVHLIDSSVYELTKAVKTTGLNVNFVFVSDHGMTKADTLHPLIMPPVDTNKFITSGDGLLVELYAKNPKYIQATYEQLLKGATKDYKVYLKTNMPAKLHYGAGDDRYNRIGDILIIPNWPKAFKLYKTMDPGWHGYDATVVKDMHATFYAWGPAFKNKLVIPAFENVDVFPMINQILGLSYTNKVDGTKELADKILK